MLGRGQPRPLLQTGVCTPPEYQTISEDTVHHMGRRGGREGMERGGEEREGEGEGEHEEGREGREGGEGEEEEREGEGEGEHEEGGGRGREGEGTIYRMEKGAMMTWEEGICIHGEGARGRSGHGAALRDKPHTVDPPLLSPCSRKRGRIAVPPCHIGRGCRTCHSSQ